MHKHGAGMTMHIWFSVCAIALLLLLAACGGSSSPTATGGSTPTVAPTATPTPTPMPTPTATEASASGNSVTIANFAFSPQSLTVKVGTKVTWTNNDVATHTVTATNKAFDSGPLSNGKTFSFTFTKAGTYTYGCSIHPRMQATIIVQ